MKPLTETQKKAAWIVASILLFIHFLPNMYRTAMQAITSAQHSQTPAKPSAGVPYPPVPPKPALTLGLSPQMKATFVGKWEGSELLPNNDQCRVKLEISLAPDQPGGVSAYETRNCIALAPGSGIPRAIGGMIDLARGMQPVSTVMSGSAVQSDLTFHVDKTIGTAPDVCPMTAYTVSKFGDQSIVAQWQEASCATNSGQMVLTRSRG